MAFEDYESSRASSQPVELYQFVYGVEADGTTPIYFAYTDGEAEVTHDSIIYVPLAGLERTKLESKGKLDSNEVRVTVPRTSGVADLFRIFPPGRVVTVVIRQGNVPNPSDPSSWALGENFPVAWLGRVLESSREGPEATLTCESASASMKRPGLRRNYQWPCPLALYGSRCQADQASATVTATVASATGNKIVLSEPWQKQVPVDPLVPLGAQEDVGVGNYIGGLVEWAGPSGPERLSILRINGTAELVLTGPARDLAPTDTLEVSLGCPHTMAACGSLHVYTEDDVTFFSNVVNYGGHPFIPTFNPLNKNNHS